MFCKPICFLICVFAFAGVKAQHWGVELNGGPGLFIKKFTHDSLVFQQKQGNIRLTFSAYASLLGKFNFQNSPISLLGGIGLRYDQLSINRKEEHGGFLGLPGYPGDSISLKKMVISTDSYVFPLGIEYAFKGKPKRRHHLAARLMVMPGQAYDTKAYTIVDSAKQANKPMNLQQLSAAYEQPVSRFSLSIMPQLFFSLYMGNSNLSFNLSIVPVAIDLMHVNKAYIKPGMGAMLSAGFQYEFMNKDLRARYN